MEIVSTSRGSSDDASPTATSRYDEVSSVVKKRSIFILTDTVVKGNIRYLKGRVNRDGFLVIRKDLKRIVIRETDQDTGVFLLEEGEVKESLHLAQDGFKTSITAEYIFSDEEELMTILRGPEISIMRTRKDLKLSEAENEAISNQPVTFRSTKLVETYNPSPNFQKQVEGFCNFIESLLSGYSRHRDIKLKVLLGEEDYCECLYRGESDKSELFLLHKNEYGIEQIEASCLLCKSEIDGRVQLLFHCHSDKGRDLVKKLTTQLEAGELIAVESNGITSEEESHAITNWVKAREIEKRTLGKRLLPVLASTTSDIAADDKEHRSINCVQEDFLSFLNRSNGALIDEGGASAYVLAKVRTTKKEEAFLVLKIKIDNRAGLSQGVTSYLIGRRSNCDRVEPEVLASLQRNQETDTTFLGNYPLTS